MKTLLNGLRDVLTAVKEICIVFGMLWCLVVLTTLPPDVPGMAVYYLLLMTPVSIGLWLLWKGVRFVSSRLSGHEKAKRKRGLSG